MLIQEHRAPSIVNHYNKKKYEQGKLRALLELECEFEQIIPEYSGMELLNDGYEDEYHESNIDRSCPQI